MLLGRVRGEYVLGGDLGLFDLSRETCAMFWDEEIVLRMRSNQVGMQRGRQHYITRALGGVVFGECKIRLGSGSM